MKKMIVGLLSLVGFSGAAAIAACVDYTDPAKAADAGTGPAPTQTQQQQAPPPAGASTVFAPPPDAGNACAQRAYRGGTPGSVVCPGVASCECPGPGVCCMQKVDSNSGMCSVLANCRNIAIQCDGPEDCGGAVCCLENRGGGGTSCKAATSCSGDWLCRSDNDCMAAAAGPHCMPIDLGVPGVDDKGLDGIIGICGK